MINGPKAFSAVPLIRMVEAGNVSELAIYLIENKDHHYSQLHCAFDKACQIVPLIKHVKWDEMI